MFTQQNKFEIQYIIINKKNLNSNWKKNIGIKKYVGKVRKILLLLFWYLQNETKSWALNLRDEYPTAQSFFSQFELELFYFLDLRHLQEQVKKSFCDQKLFWPFTVWINWSSDPKKFSNSRPSASNFKSFSRSLEQFIQTVKGQNNFW